MKILNMCATVSSQPHHLYSNTYYATLILFSVSKQFEPQCTTYIQLCCNTEVKYSMQQSCFNSPLLQNNGGTEQLFPEYGL